MNMPSPAQNSDDPIVSIDSLTRHFGEKKALDKVSISVKRGQVFGIVGENGAGKTTLIKHILGLYKAQMGTVSVFGADPVQSPEAVLSRIGYLSEQPDMPAWMRVSELVNYLSAFYPSWDDDYAQQLIGMFGIDQRTKIKALSKGQMAQVGLCVAQAHRPDLLLLDEPSSGLDPIVRRDILSAIIRTVVDEGRTVIFSSHLLDEVERVSDHLMMLSAGRVLLSESMEEVLAGHHRMTIRDSGKHTPWRDMPGVIGSAESGGEWQLDCFGDLDRLMSDLAQNGAEILSHRSLSLNDIFMARSKRSGEPTEAV